MRHFILLLSGLLALSTLVRPAHAAASYDNCTGFITSVPTLISKPGTWCLKQDVATSITSGNAITVSGEDVVLDCNGFRLDGLGGGAGTEAIGVFATRKKTTLRNCLIRGFYRGAWLNGPGGRNLVEQCGISADGMPRRTAAFDDARKLVEIIGPVTQPGALQPLAGEAVRALGEDGVRMEEKEDLATARARTRVHLRRAAARRVDHAIGEGRRRLARTVAAAAIHHHDFHAARACRRQGRERGADALRLVADRDDDRKRGHGAIVRRGR